MRQKKCDYTTSLRNLERISDSIHEQRSIGGISNASSARRERGTVVHGVVRGAVAKGRPGKAHPMHQLIHTTTLAGALAESEAAGPPPYQPTAPPAYDAHHFEEDDQVYYSGQGAGYRVMTLFF